MVKSLITLFQAPYNKQRLLFVIYRFIEWKFIRIFKLNDYKKNLWGNKKIYLNYDSLQSMWIMYNYIVVWEEFNLIRNYVKKGDVVFDVGSNMGFYTFGFLNLLKKMARYFVLSLIQIFFYRLNKNIELNCLGHRRIQTNQL